MPRRLRRCAPRARAGRRCCRPRRSLPEIAVVQAAGGRRDDRDRARPGLSAAAGAAAGLSLLPRWPMIGGVPELPSGTVTFVFTDVEGSTRLIEELGEDGYLGALAGRFAAAAVPDRLGPQPN